MPTPLPGETQSEFIERCIPIVLDEGTAQDDDQAVAVCNSMWEDGRSKPVSSDAIEFRYARPVEYRAEKNQLVGHAAVFFNKDDPGTVFTPFEGHREIVNRHAFDDVLASKDDVIATFNHNENQLLARRSSGTLRLSTDRVGLRFEIDLADTAVGRDVSAHAKRGDLGGASILFVADDQRFTRDDEGVTTREILRVNPLIELGPVVNPAFKSTSVAARSLDPLRNERETWIQAQEYLTRKARFEEIGKRLA